MSVNFPGNPADGTIYEPQPGVFYVYDIATKTWVRTDGGPPGLATPLTNGLMSAEDLKKLNRIVMPPPQSTLAAEDCTGLLSGGIIEFTVGDQFLSIDGTAKLMNEVAGISSEDAQVVSRDLHQHTNSFDFRVDTDIFYEHMESTGKFRVITTQGRTGPAGDIGAPGKNSLPHGSKGPDGLSGANAPFDVDLEVDPIALEKKTSSKRAIVGFDVENVSEDENYLVAYRSAIGNPNACPVDIRLTSSLKSTWAVCMPPNISDAQISSDECFICSGDLYYIDLSFILQSIENEFDREVVNLKNGMESIVSFWMTVMSGVFDEQKAALCCALEHCRSQSRNQDTRRYIEQSRIQAAQSDHSIIIESDPDEDTKSVTIMEPSCDPNGFGSDNSNGLPNNQDPMGGTNCVPWIMFDEDGKPIKYDSCPAGFTPRDIYRDHLSSINVLQLSSDRIIAEILAKPQDIIKTAKIDVAKILADDEPEVVAPILSPTSLILSVDSDKIMSTSDLAKGRYSVSISGLLKIDDKYTAGATIKYESDGPKTTKIPYIISSDKKELIKAYKSLAIQIDHDGGPISVSTDVPDHSDGVLELSFISGKKAANVQSKVLKSLKRPEKENETVIALSRRAAGYCEITSDYIRWYEKCWKLRKCSGAVVEVAGQDFVVIYRDDSKISCGPVAIAWPTLDGENFMPSTGKIMFHNLHKHEKKVLELLEAGKYRSKVGKLSDITKIFFPSA